jgi:hypothetical protein
MCSTLLVRIFRQVSTAAADPGTSTALRSVGLLDVLSSTPAEPSLRAPCSHDRLRRLATKPGEKCGLLRKTISIMQECKTEAIVHQKSKNILRLSITTGIGMDADQKQYKGSEDYQDAFHGNDTRPQLAWPSRPSVSPVEAPEQGCVSHAFRVFGEASWILPAFVSGHAGLSTVVHKYGNVFWGRG